MMNGLEIENDAPLPFVKKTKSENF